MLPVIAHRRTIGQALPAAGGLLELLRRIDEVLTVAGLDQLLQLLKIVRAMPRQMRLPEQLGGLGVGQCLWRELLGQGGVAQVVVPLDQGWQLREEGLDVFEQARKRDIGRLHAKQQAGLPIDLSDATEYCVAHLQLDT